MHELTIGVTARGWFLDKLRDLLPPSGDRRARERARLFECRGTGENVDALLYSAEAGAAWTLVYPEFSVVTPLPEPVSTPLVFPYGGVDDAPMDELIDHWVLLKSRDGALQEVYDYWILGQGSEPHEPRWSIVRDVLGWAE